MIRRSNDSAELDFPTRPAPVRFAGWIMLLAAAVLILGGALRSQANMINSGLMCLMLGLLMAPGAIVRGGLSRLAVVVVLVIGAVYALIT